MSELVTKSVAQEQQEQKIETRTAGERITRTHHRLYHRCESRGSARRPRRHGRLRAGQVLAEIAERNRVLRLQGIRGLVGGLFRADRPKYSRSSSPIRRSADPKSLSDCGYAVPYASEGKGLHLPPVPEALSRACPDIQVPGAAVGSCSAFAVCCCCVTCLVRIQLKLADFLHSVRVASVRAGCRQAIDVYGYCSREPLQAV